MARILLVDDEPLTTATLQTLILDEMPEVEVRSVNSAVEALELLNKNVYDVVVTDVSMPRVSGLELLDRIKRQGTLCYVIVLTAYNSFDYAYRASQYEDVRFILKIEPPQIILEAVRTGLDRVRMYYSASEDDQRIRQYMKETLPLLRQTLLERLLVFGEPLPEKSIRESCGLSIIPGEDTWLAVSGSIASQEKQQEICCLVLSMLSGMGVRADAWYTGNGLVFLMQHSQAALPAAIRGRLDRIIEGTDPGVGLSFVLSSAAVPWEKLGESVSALSGFARRELENSRILLKDPLPEESRSLSFSDALRWRRCIERREFPSLMEDLRACLLRQGYPQGRQTCALLLQMQLREAFGEACLDGLRADGVTAEAALLHKGFDSPDAWLAQVRALLETLFSGGSADQPTETEETLNRINRYIREHYAEQISLTQIAERFGYNSSYLSRIYKQNMDEGLNEHIIRTRIEAACALLRDTGMSSSEIAGQCGFQTNKYFITVFKRVTGQTPKSWREEHSLDEKGK